MCLRRVKHGRDDAAQHANGEKADLLVFADFAEVGDADSQVSERTVPNDIVEVILVQSSNNLKRCAGDPL